MSKKNSRYKFFFWLICLVVVCTFIDKKLHLVGKFRRHIYPDTLMYLYAHSKKGRKEKSAKKDHFSMQTSLEIEYPVTEEKPFVVLIPSYNNEDFCERNLESVFSQNYSNYRVIYIDDQSSDKTLSLVKKCIKKHQKEQVVTVISNPKRSLKMENVYRAIHEHCKDHEIVMMLDGDDWLLHEEVLNQFNKGYANPHVWVAYGKAIEHPDYKIIRGHLMSDEFFSQKQARRESVFFMCMPRTFYAGLYKKIRLEDLMYRGEFFKVNADLAAIFPLAELAAGHVLHIKQLMYSINRSNPINDSKIRLQAQLEIDEYIRSLPPYQTLRQEEVAFLENPLSKSANACAMIASNQVAKKKQTDILLFAKTSPMHVCAALDSIKKYGKGIDKISVILKLYGRQDASVAEREKTYTKLKRSYPDVEFRIDDDLKNFDLREYLSFNRATSHLIIANDSLMLAKPIDFSSGIDRMEKTAANQLFFGLNRFDTSWLSYINHPVEFPDNISAWQYMEAHPFKYIEDLLTFTMVEKRKVLLDLPEGAITLSTLENKWLQAAESKAVGLFLTNPGLHLLPSIPSKDGIANFNQGRKFDAKRICLGELNKDSCIVDSFEMPASIR